MSYSLKFEWGGDKVVRRKEYEEIADYGRNINLECYHSSLSEWEE